MQGVPQQFPFEKDSAQFRHLSHLPGVELYQAHIERYAFEPHTHDAFAIGTVDTGAERFRYRGAQHLAAPGALVLMNPDELHTGEAETPGGWCYRMLYLAPEALEQLSGDRSQWFTDAVRHDPRAAQRLSAILAALWQTDVRLCSTACCWKRWRCCNRTSAPGAGRKPRRRTVSRW